MIYGDNDDDDDDNAKIYRLTQRRRAVVYCRLLHFRYQRDERKEGKENYKRNTLSSTYLDVIPTSSSPPPPPTVIDRWKEEEKGETYIHDSMIIRIHVHDVTRREMYTV